MAHFVPHRPVARPPPRKLFPAPGACHPVPKRGVVATPGRDLYFGLADFGANPSTKLERGWRLMFSALFPGVPPRDTFSPVCTQPGLNRWAFCFGRAASVGSGPAAQHRHAQLQSGPIATGRTDSRPCGHGMWLSFQCGDSLPDRMSAWVSAPSRYNGSGASPTGEKLVTETLPLGNLATIFNCPSMAPMRGHRGKDRSALSRTGR